MTSIFANLPNVIINKILHFIRVIKYRNGKYIDTIPLTDIRYKIIQKVSRPIRYIDSNKCMLQLINRQNADWFGFTLTYYFIDYNDNIGYEQKNHLLTIQSIKRINDGYDKYYKYGSRNIYIYDTNDNIYKSVEYSN